MWKLAYVSKEKFLKVDFVLTMRVVYKNVPKNNKKILVAFILDRKLHNIMWVRLPTREVPHFS